jgi:YesN/AraC family two-component response regulator
VDILLCDIEMQLSQGDAALSGLDLVEWVRKTSPRTVCIFLTCHDEFSYAQRALSLQAMDYILKPAAPADIVAVLEKALRTIEATEKSRELESLGSRYVKELVNEGEEEGYHRAAEAAERVCRYIQAHIDEELPVEELAGIAYVSPNYLTRIFKKERGMTVVEYLTEARLTLAKHLLEESSLTVTMISGKVGYNNYTYFTKVFKKRYGATPIEYRATQRTLRGQT